MTLMSRIKQLLHSAEPEEPVVLSALDEINLQIDTAAKDIRIAYSSRKRGIMRCKATDDLYFTKIQELKPVLAELRIKRSEMYLDLFNTFELNTPCTVEYVMRNVGLPYIAMATMIRKSDYINKCDDSTYKNRIANMYVNIANMYETSPKKEAPSVIEIDFVSSTELKITNYSTYPIQQHTCHMKLPNWRFVQSNDSYIFYVERYEP